MNTARLSRFTTSGFTLVEVAIATGIAAGVLAILTMVMGTLSSDVKRLKPYEATLRPAFVNSGPPSSTPSSSNNTNTNTTPTSSTPTTPTVSLPDANLDPSKRPDASQPPPDPNTPAPAPTSSSTGTTGTSGTTPP